MPAKKGYTDPAQTGGLLPAIAYYRFSSHRQGEQSIEGQRMVAVQWAEANGYTIVKEYIDRAMTGKNDDREQFQLMLRELDKLRPAVLILWKVDRMGRNKEEIAFNKYRCKKSGVKVVYTAEHIPNTPEGVILESVMEGLAEYYSLQLSQNVSRGMRVSASKCQTTGGVCPLGYKLGANKRLEIDEEKAAIVRQIFSRYTAGESQAEIVKSLNAQGFRTGWGRQFSYNSLRSVLKNEKYMGVYTYKNEVRIEGGVPAIIDSETYMKAQEMMKVNKRAPAHKWSKADYILTEKLFCGRCGEAMVGLSGTSHTGGKHNYYACTGKLYAKRSKRQGRDTAGACSKKNVRKEWIEELVLRETKALLYDDDLLDFIAENTYNYYVAENSDTSYTDTLRANLQETEKALGNLLKAIEAGIFTDTTKSRMEELEEQKKQILASLETAKLRTGLELTKGHILFFLKKFREMDFDDLDCQKRLVQTFINAVFVYDNRVTITFNYSGDGRTITLPEVDGATTVSGGVAGSYAPCYRPPKGKPPQIILRRLSFFANVMAAFQPPPAECGRS